jgi:hypothetical protein
MSTVQLVISNDDIAAAWAVARGTADLESGSLPLQQIVRKRICGHETRFGV